MPEPIAYSEVVKLEQFIWEECTARLPHALDCAAWIYVIGLEDRALDEKSSENLGMDDKVLGLEVDFWDEIPRVKLYSEDIRRYWNNKEEFIQLFDYLACKYVQRVSDGYQSTWIAKSVQIPDEKFTKRPEWVVDWQALPIKKGYAPPQIEAPPPTVVEEAPAPKPEVAPKPAAAPKSKGISLQRQTPSL